MRNFDLRKLQLKEMEILLEVDRICKKYNINYYLSWGSALGAIRHKGFIPWDDDIDISMFFKDYVKFKEVCSRELDSKFFYQSSETDKNIWLSWDKIRINNTTSMDRKLSHIRCHWGVCIDIFPIITVPESEKEQKKQKNRTYIYKRLCQIPFVLNSKQGGIKARIKKMIYRILDNNMVEHLKKSILKKIVMYEESDSELCGEILSMEYKKSIMKKEYFGTPKYVLFEEDYFPIPEKYNEYLIGCYGDYMKLPDISERIGHGDIIVDLENSFKKYQ